MANRIAPSFPRAGLVWLALGLAAMPVCAMAESGAARVAAADDQQQDIDAQSGTQGGSNSTDAKPYSFELGVLPHTIDNYYQTQEDFGVNLSGAARGVTAVTLSAAASYDLIRDGGRKLTAGAKLRHNLYTDLDHANSTDVDLTLVYDAKPSLLKLGYFGSRHRLVSDTPGNFVYGAVNGASLDYAYRFTKRLRGRAGYRFTRQTYSSNTSRNLSEHNFSADLRYQIVRAFMPSIGVEYSSGNAALSAFSYHRKAIYVGVTSELGDNVYLNFRYRRSQRDYTTKVPSDSYFGREDPRDDLSFYGTVQLGGGLSLFGYANHINNRSNQPSHHFDSNEAGLGLFFRF